MKHWSNYIKEMKIAARGFYFYMEIIFAAVILLILLVAVNEESVSKEKEFLYYDMPDEVFELYWEQSIQEGKIVVAEPTMLEAKAVSFELENLETGKVESFELDKQTYELITYDVYEEDGTFEKHLYIADTREAMLHLNYLDRSIGAVTGFNDEYEFTYDYIIQGYETDRLKDLLYILVFILM